MRLVRTEPPFILKTHILMLVSFVFLGQQIAQIGHNEYLCSFYLCFWVNILRKQDIMNMM